MQAGSRRGGGGVERGGDACFTAWPMQASPHLRDQIHLKTLHRGIHKRSGLAQVERKRQERGIIPEPTIKQRARRAGWVVVWDTARKRKKSVKGTISPTTT